MSLATNLPVVETLPLGLLNELDSDEKLRTLKCYTLIMVARKSNYYSTVVLYTTEQLNVQSRM